LSGKIVQGPPQAHGVGVGEVRPPVGRAQRFATDAGGELWRFSSADDPAVDRLVALGDAGIGGFVLGGEDETGAWLHRRALEPTLQAWFRDRPGARPWHEAVAIARAIAAILARAEAKSLVPGRVSPGQVAAVDEGGGLHLRADALVSSLCGAPAEGGTGSGDGWSRWTPPEQTAGAPWDAAANRYVLGLVLYRLLAGEHPFSGKGLRRGIDDQSRGAPPLPDAVASALPPGLQSLCLRLLDGEPHRRPMHAGEIETRLAELQAGASVRAIRPEPAVVPMRSRRFVTEIAAPADPVARSSAETTPPLRRRRASTRAWLPRVATPLSWIGVALGGLALSAVLVGDPPPAQPAAPRLRDAAPLSADTTAPDDCIGCHPDHAAQWHLSIMAHAVKSPLFLSLEMLIEEQVGRDFDCPEGAGILRTADPRTACRDRDSGLPVTGSGGELWCVNCHAPGSNLGTTLPSWDGRSRRSTSRQPLSDLLPSDAMEGISCAFCHQTHGPVRPGDARNGGYEGNPTWRSTATGEVFVSRPEDRRGVPGIANSGYALDPAELLRGALDGADADARTVPGGAHLRPTTEASAYLRSSEFCGACHDVRLFGTDVIGVAQRGEHFKRLRNAYSEWSQWADTEVRAGRSPSSCQDCHMSAFPGVCVADGPGGAPGDTALSRACPPGTQFSPRSPGDYPEGQAAIGSAPGRVTPHYFSGVDLPLSAGFEQAAVDEASLDEHGIPRGPRARRDLLLGSTFRFELPPATLSGDRLDVPVVIENIGGGHRVPAGFSQEREIWVHLRVTDGDGRVIYEVGRVDRGDEDLHDKRFARVNVDDALLDREGRPLGMFGADVVDGPDVPQWDPPPETGGTRFRGRGLINMQNGFLRCVRCIGFIDGAGRCQPGPGQGRHRADRFADGAYDPDTGICESNLSGSAALFEIYFPVGALDATRGVVRGPDAIVDTRSAPPGVERRYTYELSTRGARGPIRIEARLLFRAFPPFLVRAFADYEARQAAQGKRPSGPLVDFSALDRIEIVEIARREQELSR
jgi:eukaryotic-like serine/threonine-protein kinase